MARKNDTDAALGVVIFIMIALVVIAYFLIKWAIIGLIIVISAITVWIINLCRKSSRKKAIREIEDRIFSNSDIKPMAKVDKKGLKEILGIFDIDIYNDLFESKIRPRGQLYYADNKVQNVKQDANKWTCTINGTNKYDVFIKFENNKIVSSNCTCPYHQEDNKNCKHLYALLLKAKSEKNIPIILQSITSFSGKVTEMINEETKYISENQKSLQLDDNRISEFKNKIEIFKNKLERANYNIEKYKYNENILIDTFIDLIESSYSFNKNIENIIVESGKVDNPVSVDKVYNATHNDDKIKLSDVATGYFIVDGLSKIGHKKDKDYDEELEREMDDYMLEDWQKDLVRKGEYNPWNFEEDGDLEEDDYYYEDDK